jgi:hypothetical protein
MRAGARSQGWKVNIIRRQHSPISFQFSVDVGGFWKGLEVFMNQVNDQIQGRLQGSATVNETDDDQPPVPPRWMMKRDEK